MLTQLFDLGPIVDQYIMVEMHDGEASPHNGHQRAKREERLPQRHTFHGLACFDETPSAEVFPLHSSSTTYLLQSIQFMSFWETLKTQIMTKIETLY